MQEFEHTRKTVKFGYEIPSFNTWTKLNKKCVKTFVICLNFDEHVEKLLKVKFFAVAIKHLYKFDFIYYIYVINLITFFKVIFCKKCEFFLKKLFNICNT